jgi:hypothetical protein
MKIDKDIEYLNDTRVSYLINIQIGTDQMTRQCAGERHSTHFGTVVVVDSVDIITLKELYRWVRF